MKWRRRRMGLAQKYETQCRVTNRKIKIWYKKREWVKNNVCCCIGSNRQMIVLIFLYKLERKTIFYFPMVSSFQTSFWLLEIENGLWKRKLRKKIVTKHILNFLSFVFCWRWKKWCLYRFILMSLLHKKRHLIVYKEKINKWMFRKKKNLDISIKTLKKKKETNIEVGRGGN